LPLFYAAFFTDALLRRVLTYSVVLYGAEVVGRGAWSGVLYLCLVAPYLLAVYAGSLIDSALRRTVLRLTSTLSLLLMLCLAIATRQTMPRAWVVAALILGYGVVSSFSYPAFIAAVADVAEPSRVTHSTAVMSVLSLFSQVAGPVAVGVLRATVSWPNLFVATVGLAAVPWLAVRAARLPIAHAVAPRRRSIVVAMSPWVDIAEIRAYARQHRTLATWLLAVALFSVLVVGPLEVLAPLFAAKTLGLPPLVAGAFIATGGMGLVIGALAALALVGRRRSGSWMCGCVVAGSVVVLCMTAAPRPLAFPMFFIGGALAGVFSSLSLAGVQSAATPELRGRVIGAFAVVLGAPPAIGGAVAGAMSDSLGTPATMRIIFSVVAVAFLALYLARPALRQA
jgi:MFS family permease